VLNAIVTIPLLYMIRLDGFGFSKFGTHGLLWTDALANLVVLRLWSLYLWFVDWDCGGLQLHGDRTVRI
jgi:hypothetical protein